MSNSPLANQDKSLRVKYYASGRTDAGRKYRIDTITIHQIWGHMTNQQLANYFNSLPSSSMASCNYTVADDGSIGMLVDEGDRSFCSSSRRNDVRAVTIETSNDRTYPNACTEKALQSLINLSADVCKRNGITKMYYKPEIVPYPLPSTTQQKEANEKAIFDYADSLGRNEGLFTLHEFFFNKECPGDFIKSKIPYIVEEVNKMISGDIKVGDKVEMEVYDIKDGFAFGKVKIEDKSPAPQPAPAPKEFKVGAKVTINSGAVAGGLSGTRGKAINPKYANGTFIDTIDAISTHYGVKEARLKTIWSWVALDSLTLV